MSTTATLTKAWPMVATDGVTGLDNDRDFRLMLAAMMSPDVVTGDAMAARPGVLPHQWDTNQSVTTLRVQQTGTASMSVDVLGGPFVCVRSGQGPYLGWGESSVNLTVPTADPSNPRVDLVYAWVGDQVNFSGIDTSHGPMVALIAGDPAPSNPVPKTGSLPDGAVVLATINVAAHASSIAKANIILARHGTCLSGGTRRMLEGDNVSDAGRVDGEQRYRQAVSPLPALLDYWDAVQGVWRGTQTLNFTAAFPGASGTTSGSSRLTLITFTVPDPGWPYRVKTSGVVRLSGGTCNFYASVNNGPFSSGITTIQAGDVAGPRYLVPSDSGILTGPSVVRVNIDPITPFATVTWATDTRNKLLVEVDPQ